MASNFVTININNRVRFRVTPEARSYYASYYFSQGGKEIVLNVDHLGYAELPIYEFMAVFGREIQNSGYVKRMIPMEIEVEVLSGF